MAQIAALTDIELIKVKQRPSRGNYLHTSATDLIISLLVCTQVIAVM